MSKEKWILEYAIKRGWAKIGGVHWEMAEEAYYTHLHGKLRPCPFCGGSANLEVKSLDERHGYAIQAIVLCDCGATIAKLGSTSKEGYADNSKVVKQVFDAWNNRV